MANKAKRFEIIGNEIVIRMPLVPVMSKSKKSLVIASTRGRESFEHEGEIVHVNLNVYKMNPDAS